MRRQIKRAARRSACRKRTPPEIAERYGVSPDKVLAWIRSGELRAINVATRPSGRPRYVVDEEDLEQFEERRRVHPPEPGRKKKREPDGVIEFF